MTKPGTDTTRGDGMTHGMTHGMTNNFNISLKAYLPPPVNNSFLVNRPPVSIIPITNISLLHRLPPLSSHHTLQGLQI